MKEPYIGICDFTSRGDIQVVAELLLERRKPGSNRRLMAGVMMSHATLHGLPSEWTGIFPTTTQVPKIFRSWREEGIVMQTIHYANYEDPCLGLVQDLCLLWPDPGISALQAIQLDMVWPKVPQLRAYARLCPKRELILQVSERAIREAGNDPQAVVSMLAQYGNLLHFALFDCSIGRGISLNAEFLLPYLRAVRDTLPHIGLAVAGGLGPDTVELLKPIVEEFPHISIDAQAGLRKSRSAKDPLDMDRAGEYLIKALALLD
jgi:hypothetical protein